MTHADHMECIAAEPIMLTVEQQETADACNLTQDEYIENLRELRAEGLIKDEPRRPDYFKSPLKTPGGSMDDKNYGTGTFGPQQGRVGSNAQTASMDGPELMVMLIRIALKAELDKQCREVISAQDHVIRRLEHENESLRIQMRDLREAMNKRLAHIEQWMHTHPGITPNAAGELPTIKKPRKQRRVKKVPPLKAVKRASMRGH